jgi:hypothetical protein
MTDETRTALRNYNWLVRNRDAGLQWDDDSGELVAVFYGDGGVAPDALCDPGFTRPHVQASQPCPLV